MSKWKIITNQRTVVLGGSRGHAMWRVACNKREGEKILRIERA